MKKVYVVFLVLIVFLLSGCYENTIKDMMVVNITSNEKLILSEQKDIESFFKLQSKGTKADPKADAILDATYLEVFFNFESKKEPLYMGIWINDEHNKAIIQYEKEKSLIKLKGKNVKELSELFEL